MNNTLVEKKFECFEIEIKEKIAHIILNRPEKMNSMPPSFWSDLPEIINEIDNVKIHNISGVHPAGNVGVQIHHIDPVNSGEKVWVVGAEDVALIGKLFLTGEYNPTRTIAVSGPPVKYPQYYKTIVGSSLSEIIKDAGIDTDLHQGS